MQFPKRIRINEVGMRDGLQLEDRIFSVDEKAELIGALVRAGMKTVEFGAFVHPKLVPQMAGSDEVFRRIRDLEADFIGLIPNLTGAKLAAAAGVQRVNSVISASNTHNLQNVRRTTEQSLEGFREIAAFCREQEMLLDCAVSTSFGCPFEGAIAPDRVFWVVDELIQAGVNEISIADTTGIANPAQVYSLASELKKRWPEQVFTLHFHNTRGMGLANLIAGMQAGITSFDASLGGLDGCPFAPGATGNICTEDTVHMLGEMGIETGLDLDLLIEASKRLEVLAGHQLPGHVIKSGKSTRLYPVPS